MDGFCRIEMLGRLRVELPSGVVDRFRTQRAGWILAYLALRLRQDVPRERLIDLFWPDSELELGRASLKNALSSLRRQLGPGDIVVADRQRVRLSAQAVRTDVEEFEAALRKGDRASLERAAELYAGEFLPGCYDEWAELEQRRLHELHLDGLERLGDALEAEGEASAALGVVRRAIRADAFREGLYVRLVRLQLLLGHVAAAAESFAKMKRLFEEEVGAPPSKEVVAAVKRLLGAPVVGTARTPAPRPAPPVPVRAEPTAPRLPLLANRFFGREEERRRLVALLLGGEERLVTLLGPGGAGKTRLALEVAHEFGRAFEGRTWWVGLADLEHGSQVAGAVLRALRVSAQDSEDPIPAILSGVGSSNALLVLDNLEHLLGDEPTSSEGALDDLDDTTRIVRELLERAPRLRVLATSRRPLRLDGERAELLPPLEVPGDSDRPEAILASASAALYLDRARLARPDFAVTANNAQAVAGLCRLLEGIPLAIEMAAAWARIVPPAKMLERLAVCLDDLTSRRRDLPARHQSLRATVDWSYSLLGPEQQRLLARLSVFQGGWTLEAAEGVDGSGETADLLLSLVEKSLVVAEPDDEEPRYRFLEAIRRYAAERLAEGREGEAARARHFDYFLRFIEAEHPRFRTREEPESFRRVEREIENLRAALDWAGTPEGRAREPDDAELALVSMLRVFLEARGALREARTRLEAALARPVRDPLSPHRARALLGAGTLAFHMGDWEEARARYAESFGILEATGDGIGVGNVAMGLGNVELALGNHDAADRWYGVSLQVGQAHGADWLMEGAHSGFGDVAEARGDLGQSQRHHEECLRIARRSGIASRAVSASVSLAGLLLRGRRFADAYRALNESLLAASEAKTIRDILVLIGRGESLLGRQANGARLLGAARVLSELIGARPETYAVAFEDEARLAMGREPFADALSKGAALNEEEATAFAFVCLREADFDKPNRV